MGWLVAIVVALVVFELTGRHADKLARKYTWTRGKSELYHILLYTYLAAWVLAFSAFVFSWGWVFVGIALAAAAVTFWPTRQMAKHGEWA